MLSEALQFLRARLNEHLLLASGQMAGSEASEGLAVFPDGERMDPVVFKLGAVTLLLMNVEEERVMRPPDRYAVRDASGQTSQVVPEIRLDLSLLLVARYKNYEDSLRALSRVVQFFQRFRSFDPSTTPGMPEGLGKLVLELMPMPFSQQNDLWNALRTTYHPSVLYSVKMVSFPDPLGTEVPSVGDMRRELSHAP